MKAAAPARLGTSAAGVRHISARPPGCTRSKVENYGRARAAIILAPGGGVANNESGRGGAQRRRSRSAATTPRGRAGADNSAASASAAAAARRPRPPPAPATGDRDAQPAGAGSEEPLTESKPNGAYCKIGHFSEHHHNAARLGKWNQGRGRVMWS